MFTHSIRWRLQLWLAFLLVGVLSGFVVAALQLQRVNQFNQLDEELELRTAALGRSVRGGPGPGPGRPAFESKRGGPGFGEGSRRPMPPEDRPAGPPGGWPDPGLRPREIRLSPGVQALFDDSQTNGFYFSIWSRDRQVLKRSTNAPPDLPVPNRLRSDTRTHLRTRDIFREAYHFTELGDCVLAGRDITADLRALNWFTFWLLSAGGAVLALGLGGGWWLTTRALRPVEDISAAATRISGGNLAGRIPVADPEDELGRLAAVLNSTFARLESAFVRQKQFTADASHELRTPLAVLITEAQTTLARERSTAEYRDTVETCLQTAQQMRRLTESLLQLARFDAGQALTQPVPVDLAVVARDCVAHLFPIASPRGVRLTGDFAPAGILGDADQLNQVTINLLTNALHHSRDNSEVRIDTGRDGDSAWLTVTDHGEGIAPEDLPHIFERFYRADKSRARSEGRTGLGLAITKAIVDAHRGTIAVSSHPGEGSTFSVRIPAVSPSPSRQPLPDCPIEK